LSKLDPTNWYGWACLPASIQLTPCPPDWQKSLDQETLTQLNEMTSALRKYMADQKINTPLPTTLTLDDLVRAKYIKEIPPAPSGKQFAISRTYAIVVVIDNK
jgi:hypothetical protein